MTHDDWEKIKYFTPDEKWGDPKMMDQDLIFGLDRLREFIRLPIHIHCGYEKRVDGGWHPTGRAVDIHIEGLHPMEQFLAASRFSVFNGIGVYLWWTSPGLHLDTRPFTGIAYRAVWGSTAKKVYCPLNTDFLRKAAKLTV